MTALRATALLIGHDGGLAGGAAELNVIAAGAVRGVIGGMIETIRARPD